MPKTTQDSLQPRGQDILAGKRGDLAYMYQKLELVVESHSAVQPLKFQQRADFISCGCFTCVISQNLVIERLESTYPKVS